MRLRVSTIEHLTTPGGASSFCLFVYPETALHGFFRLGIGTLARDDVQFGGVPAPRLFSLPKPPIVELFPTTAAGIADRQAAFRAERRAARKAAREAAAAGGRPGTDEAATTSKGDDKTAQSDVAGQRPSASSLLTMSLGHGVRGAGNGATADRVEASERWTDGRSRGTDEDDEEDDGAHAQPMVCRPPLGLFPPFSSSFALSGRAGWEKASKGKKNCASGQHEGREHRG